MAKLKIKKIDNSIEINIIIATIISDSFCLFMYKIYKKEFMKIEFAHQIIFWCLEYYEKYKQSPKKHIKDIFFIEKEKIRETDSEIIEGFLIELSKKYSQAEKFNELFLIDQTRKYFEDRSYEILFENGNRFINAGKIEKAKELIENHKKIIITVSDRFNPFDEKEIQSFDPTQKANKLFRLSGAAGNLIGDLERDFLVAITANEKVGKSLFCEELMFRAIPRKLKIVSFNFEMNKEKLKMRIYQRLTWQTLEKNPLVIPVFDCISNQEDTCDLEYRTNNVELFLEGDDKPEYSKSIKYTPCTYCRKNKKLQKNYKVAWWWKNLGKRQMEDKNEIRNRAKAFMRNYGDLVRIKVWPSFSAGMKDIERELDSLNSDEGFVPDIIIDDYLDIHKDSGYGDTREKTTKRWQEAKRMAGERHVLYITPDQATKASRKKESLDQEDTGESKWKDANLDRRIAISQVDGEKDDGVARLSVLFDRHRRFNQYRQVYILQCGDIANPLLDSEPKPWKRNN